MKTTIQPEEINHFQKDSAKWHDETGPFAPLHAINPLRMSFIIDSLHTHHHKIKGAHILDIGCGGGVLCESMARLGGHITGLDADSQAILVARSHADKLALDITYTCAAIEKFRRDHARVLFDIVTAMEIVEHVANMDLFLSELAACVRPGGFLFMSTLNRTIKSYLFGIMAAEHILGMVPPGTHTWRQFVKPSELARGLRPYGFEPIAINGIGYRPLRDEFYLSPNDTSVNYIMAFRKDSSLRETPPTGSTEDLGRVR